MCAITSDFFFNVGAGDPYAYVAGALLTQPSSPCPPRHLLTFLALTTNLGGIDFPCLCFVIDKIVAEGCKVSHMQ